MAANLPDEERERRIVLVAEYMLETGNSTRKTAEFFSKHLFKISNATVSDYLSRYEKNHPEEVAKYKKRFQISESEIKERILKNVKYLLSGLTVIQISELTNESYWTIYRDLTVRLPKIDSALYDEVQSIMKEHSKENIKR